jgi:hypothetical protein
MQEWWLRWLESSEVDLVWMQLLVEDGDPTVRFAGLCILASLCSKVGVAAVLLAAWKAVHPLSVWGACVKIALEPSECNLVRKQVS